MDHEISAYEIAERKLDHLVVTIDDLRKKKKEIEEEETRLLVLFAAWHKIWVSEKPLTLEAAASLPPEQFLLESEPSQIEQNYRVIVGQNDNSENMYGVKTAAVKGILEEAAESGITPRDLSQKLRDKGIKHSSSFPSNTLFRLKGKHEVFVRPDGKYALSRFEEKEKEAPEGTS
jgi:hypothetical protein